MARINIQITISDPDLVDNDHETGLSDDGYQAITDVLNQWGENVTITKEEPPRVKARKSRR